LASVFGGEAATGPVGWRGSFWPLADTPASDCGGSYRGQSGHN